jgi:two-component system alkaline phosphatase synthesis response regulator PhoP
MRARKKVLLVDDDADFIAMNKVLLEQHSYEVLVAYNGTECFDKVRENIPDLIILDMMMTTRNEGYGVSRKLRSSKLTENIPLLMLTSVNTVLPIKLEPDEKWLPVDLLIEKPVEPELLLEVIREMLSQKPENSQGE